jgi:hypothetical protein
MAQYIYEKTLRSHGSPRMACLKIDVDGKADLVALDTEEPSWQPSCVYINSEGNPVRVEWHDGC